MSTERWMVVDNMRQPIEVDIPDRELADVMAQRWNLVAKHGPYRVVRDVVAESS